MARTYEPIATYTATGNIASYTFSSIPSTYTDLVFVFSGTGTTADLYLQYNGDNAGNYSVTNLYGNGSSAGSNRASNTNVSYTGTITTSQCNVIANIQNYSNTTTYKTILSRASAANYEIQARVAEWRSTTAINSIAVKTTGSQFDTGSTFTLYGIKAA